MTAYITEHSNVQRLAAMGFPINVSPIVGYGVSSAAGGIALSSLTQYLRVTADAGTLLAISSSSTTTPTATNAFRVPPNGPAEFYAAGVGGGVPRFLNVAST